MIRTIAKLFALVRSLIGRMLPLRGPQGYDGMPGPPGLAGRDGTLSLDVKTIHAMEATGCTHFVMKFDARPSPSQAAAIYTTRERYMPGTKLLIAEKGVDLIPVRAEPKKKAVRKTAPRKAAKGDPKGNT